MREGVVGVARKPDLPCASCGKLMWRTKSSAPVGVATCIDCRRAGRGKKLNVDSPPEPSSTAARFDRSSVRSAAESGDQLKTLCALRDRLAGEIDSCDSARDLASLSARMVDVLAQIKLAAAAQPEQKGTALDELQRRRSARIAGAAGGARA